MQQRSTEDSQPVAPGVPNAGKNSVTPMSIGLPRCIGFLANPQSTPATTEDRITGQVHIGCSGWYYWHWKGTFYPPDIPSNQLFAIYQGHFRTVELNAPFYAWPMVRAVKTWIRQADPRFCVYHQGLRTDHSRQTI